MSTMYICLSLLVSLIALSCGVPISPPTPTNTGISTFGLRNCYCSKCNRNTTVGVTLDNKTCIFVTLDQMFTFVNKTDYDQFIMRNLTHFKLFQQIGNELSLKREAFRYASFSGYYNSSSSNVRILLSEHGLNVCSQLSDDTYHITLDCHNCARGLELLYEDENNSIIMSEFAIPNFEPCSNDTNSVASPTDNATCFTVFKTNCSEPGYISTTEEFINVHRYLINKTSDTQNDLNLRFKINAKSNIQVFKETNLYKFYPEKVADDCLYIDIFGKQIYYHSCKLPAATLCEITGEISGSIQNESIPISMSSYDIKDENERRERLTIDHSTPNTNNKSANDINQTTSTPTHVTITESLNEIGNESLPMKTHLNETSDTHVEQEHLEQNISQINISTTVTPTDLPVTEQSNENKNDVPSKPTTIPIDLVTTDVKTNEIGGTTLQMHSNTTKDGYDISEQNTTQSNDYTARVNESSENPVETSTDSMNVGNENEIGESNGTETFSDILNENLPDQTFELQNCICSSCDKSRTVGKIYNGICYFITTDLRYRMAPTHVNMRNLVLDKYSPGVINDKITARIFQRLVGELRELLNRNIIVSFYSQAGMNTDALFTPNAKIGSRDKCFRYDINTNELSNSCIEQVILLTANISDIQEVFITPDVNTYTKCPFKTDAVATNLPDKCYISSAKECDFLPNITDVSETNNLRQYLLTTKLDNANIFDTFKHCFRINEPAQGECVYLDTQAIRLINHTCEAKTENICVINLTAQFSGTNACKSNIMVFVPLILFYLLNFVFDVDMPYHEK